VLWWSFPARTRTHDIRSTPSWLLPVRIRKYIPGKSYFCLERVAISFCCDKVDCGPFGSNNNLLSCFQVYLKELPMFVAPQEGLLGAWLVSVTSPLRVYFHGVFFAFDLLVKRPRVFCGARVV
jgi:hypothetical protein